MYNFFELQIVVEICVGFLYLSLLLDLPALGHRQGPLALLQICSLADLLFTGYIESQKAVLRIETAEIKWFLRFSIAMIRPKFKKSC
jgi:hypothetical protein